jgi:PAS domain-containing protein
MVEDLKTSRENLENAYNEIQARNRYTMSVLNAISTGVITITRDDRIALINPSAQNLLGLRHSQAAGKPASVVLSGEYAQFLHRPRRGLRHSRIPTVTRQLTVQGGVPGQAHDHVQGVVFVCPKTRVHGASESSSTSITQLMRHCYTSVWPPWGVSGRVAAQRIAPRGEEPLTPHPAVRPSGLMRRRYLEKLGDSADSFTVHRGVLTVVIIISEGLT